MTSAISRGKLEEIINSWKKDFGGWLFYVTS
jgi:hypothetical protein